MNRIRVLLAEDHETVRQGLRLLLDAQPDIEVVAEAAERPRRRARLRRRLQPHVVVMDHLDAGDERAGGDAKAIKQVSPAAAIVALTRHDDDAYVQEMLAAGAAGYVLKQSRSTELLERDSRRRRAAAATSTRGCRSG